VATFAMGTALGDLTATTFHLGYLASGFMFAGVIAIPALGYRFLRWNAVFSFWFAYVATRPFGASFADYFGKPKSVGGVGLGDGPVALVLALVIFCLVAFLAVTHRDEQRVPAGAATRRGPGHGAPGHGPGGPGSGPRHSARSGGRVPALDYAEPYSGGVGPPGSSSARGGEFTQRDFPPDYSRPDSQGG
jgi:hypothetical protein